MRFKGAPDAVGSPHLQGEEVKSLWGKGEWPDVAVGAAYPMMLNKAIYKHMHDVEKEEHVVTLARSAWAGSQRWVRKRVFLRH